MQGSGFRVQGSGFGVQTSGFRVSVLWLRVEGWVKVLGFTAVVSFPTSSSPAAHCLFYFVIKNNNKRYTINDGCIVYRRGVFPKRHQLSPRGTAVCALRSQVEHCPVRLCRIQDSGSDSGQTKPTNFECTMLPLPSEEGTQKLLCIYLRVQG